MNNDGCDCLFFPSNQEITEENFLKLRTTDLANTQVDSLFYCTISSGFGNFTHATKVGAVLGEPLPAPDQDGGRRRNVTRDLLDQGTDPLQMVTQFAHRNKMESFWSMRMNDTHDSAHTPENPYFLFPALKKDHPEWLIGDPGNRTKHGRWSSVNYALPEIRDLAFRYLEEVCKNYDIDGIELDFFRHLTYFPSVANGGKASDEEREMMTQLIRRIRTMTESEGLLRKRPILLSIRVPDSTGFSRDMGLDLETWLAEGLVDMMMLSDYFRLHHWDTSISLGHQYGIQVIPCLSESRVKGESRFRRQSIEGYRGRAANAWSAGADGLEIFNLFNPNSPVWKELGDPEVLKPLSKLYFVTPLDGSANLWMANGEDYRVLPLLSPGHPEFLKTGIPFSTEIVVSEDPDTATNRTATLHLNLPTVGHPGRLETRLNGHLLEDGLIQKGWIDYAVAPENLVLGINRVDLLLTTVASEGAEDTWTETYDGNEIPPDSWMSALPKISEAIKIESKEGALLISDQGTVSGDYHYYYNEWGANPATKTIFEARVKVVSGSSFLIFGNGQSAERLRLSPGEIGLHHNRGKKASLDTTTDFHLYRCEMQDNDLLVFVDGKLALDLTDQMVERKEYPNRISFGAASSSEVGEAYWDFVRFRTNDAGCVLRDIVISTKSNAQ